MLVSVIIPCYNVEKYIDECVNSVLAQTHSEIEIICINNNSSDNTCSILQGFVSKYPSRIILGHQNKQGAPAARNHGMSLAKGQWLQFLDADDLLSPEKIAYQVELITKEKKEPDLIVGGILKQYKNGLTDPVELFTDNIWKGLVMARAGCTCSNLYNKPFLQKIGGWDETRKSSQEAWLLFDLLKHHCTYVFAPRELTLVRERPEGSISTLSRADNWQRYIDLRVSVRDYLIAQNILDAETETALKQQIFDSIRMVYKLDADLAQRLHNKYVKNSFIPIQSSSTSEKYMFLYKLLGFTFTEKLLALTR